jgi:hypothetical protein
MLAAAISICAFGAAQAVFAQGGDGAVDTVGIVDTLDDAGTLNLALILPPLFAIVDTLDDTGTLNIIDNADQPQKPKKSDKSGESATDIAVVKARKTEKSESTPNKKPGGNAAKEDKGGKFQPSVRTNGLIIAGADINNKVNKDSTDYNRLARAEVELSARPAKKVRAELGVKYNMKDTGIAVDKAYAQYNIIDNGSIRAGIMKKSFGLEERAGLDERCFYKRSIINDNLEELGFLDHDLTLMYRHELNAKWRAAGGFSWPAADSLRSSYLYLQNYAVQYDMSDSATFILAAVIRHSGYPSTTFASSLSFRHIAAICVSEAELTLGADPHPKMVEDTTVPLGHRLRWATLFGARVQERFPIEANTKILRQIIPIAEAAFYMEDTESGKFDMQFRVGLTLGFAKNSAFQFRNNFGTVIRTENGESSARRYRFDSEAAVIF